MNVTIIADASYCPDTGAGGYGFWIASERGKAPGGGPLKDRVDGSGAAEMMAVCNAVAQALRLGLVEPGDRLLLQTDCQSAILAFQGARNGMTTDELRAKQTLLKFCTTHNLRYSFKHVKGHMSKAKLRHMGVTNTARYTTNNLCDQRARDGMQLARAAARGQDA